MFENYAYNEQQCLFPYKHYDKWLRSFTVCGTSYNVKSETQTRALQLLKYWWRYIKQYQVFNRKKLTHNATNIFALASIDRLKKHLTPPPPPPCLYAYVYYNVDVNDI